MFAFILTLIFSFTVFALDKQIDIEYKDNKNTKDVKNIRLKLSHYYENNNDLIAFALDTQKSNNKNYNFTDLTELYWSRAEDNYELKFGLDKVFWGVAETYNIVNVINQNNNLSSENKSKLSELMFKFSYYLDSDSIDFFYLPHFREQKFTKFKINNTFFKGKKNAIALRYKGVYDNFDYAFSYFNGLGRKPLLVKENDIVNATYSRLSQFGIETQLTTEDILWKFEYAKKYQKNTNNDNIVIGFEYLLGNQIESNILLEFLTSSNKKDFFQNDIMLGVRVGLNDENSTEGLISVIYDIDNYASILNIRASSRFADNITMNLKLSTIFNSGKNSLSKINDNLSLSLSYFF